MANSQPVVIASNQTPVSVAGAVSVTNPISSVIALQGTGWSGSVAAIVTNIPTVIVGGSVVTIGTAAPNQSVSGTVGASIIGLVPVSVTNIPTVNVGTIPSIAANVQGSVATVIIGGSIAASFTPPANQSVSGTVGASIVGQLPAGVAVIGSIAVLQGTNPWQISSVYGNVSGSVVAFQGAGWSGSVVGFQGGTQITSIAGGYAEGSASVVSGLGLQMLGLRNDTMSSVFGGDGTYVPPVYGPVGESIVANAPISKWVQGDTSIFAAGPSVSVFGAQSAGIYNYMTSAQVTNFGANSVLGAWLSQSGATSSSIIGHFFAPASGGSNMLFPNAIKTGAGAALAASISGTANVYISAQGFISKT